MHDWEQGVVKIADDLCVYPGYTFEDFKETDYYKGQSSNRQIILNRYFHIEGHIFAIDLIFHNDIIYSVGLSCTDIDIPRINEKKRKELHDAILREQGIKETRFSWGEIYSGYDPIGDVSTLGFYFK